MEQSILICCSGLGMGNASRIIAVVEAISDQARELNTPVRCHIVTWGSGYRFLNEYKKESSIDFELIQIEEYSLKIRPIQHFTAFFKNVLTIRRELKRLRPKVLLLDSDYHFPAYFGAGCPVVYLGQAKDILERARSNKYRPANLRQRVAFALREKLDSLFQTLVSHRILVPSFSQSGSDDRRIQKIPLIVRKEFLHKNEDPCRKSRMALLLSGSEIERNAFLSLANDHNLPLLSPVPSRASKLDQFEVVLIQGGLSSISECIARSKFMVVVPMRDHPEQLLNAQEVERLGLGIRYDIAHASELSDLFARIERHQKLIPKTNVDCNGAETAARFILEMQ